MKLWIQEAAELLQRWGLVIREQLPVPESSSSLSAFNFNCTTITPETLEPACPNPAGKLKHRVDPDEMVREGLIVPRESQEVARKRGRGGAPKPPRRRMMEDMERYYEIKKGQIPQHDNLLAISKPEAS